MKRLFEAVTSFWLIHAFGTSIGKKLVMAITGLALCGFLVLHLGGNLLLYVGAEEYNAYAHALHAQKILLPIAEIGLLILFVGHIWLAIRTTFENNAARTTPYAVKQTKMEEGPLAAPASSTMMITGLVVLVFLIVHLYDFALDDHLRRLGIAKILHREPGADLAPFERALQILQSPVTFVVYIAGSLFLGYHLLHGFQSAFQTLGANHPKYTPIIRFVGFVFAITIAIGFASFPFWAWAFKH